MAMGEVAEALEPSAIVIAGAYAPNEDVARFAYAARAAAGALPVALYRRPRKEGQVKRASVTSLSNEPLAAQAELMAAIAPVRRTNSGAFRPRPSPLSPRFARHEPSDACSSSSASPPSSDPASPSAATALASPSPGPPA